jgi:hypothetical protein
MPISPAGMLTPLWTKARLGRQDGKVSWIAEQISEQDAGLAAHALLAAGRIGPVTTIINRAVPVELIHALESDDADPNATLGWVIALCRDRNKTAAVLATGQVRRMATIVAVARNTHPDDVPNVSGEDPWLIALRSACGTLNLSDQDFLAAFFLSRALGGASRSQAELFRYSYTRVHEAFQERRFPPETESLASSRLGWSSWLAWDSCSRLREAVTRRFVEHNLEPESFGRLTHDGALAISLIDEAARTERGRTYLGRVQRAIKDVAEMGMKSRADYIAKKLK